MFSRAGAALSPLAAAIEAVVRDPWLAWPGTLSIGPDNRLHVTTSQIHQMPRFHGGQSQRTQPCHVYRIDGYQVAQP